MNIKHIVLVLPFLFTGCSAETDAHGHGDGEGQHPAHETAEAHKCICGMEMAADAPTTEVGDLKFAFCGAKCTEMVKQDPAKYATYAITE